MILSYILGNIFPEIWTASFFLWHALHCTTVPFNISFRKIQLICHCVELFISWLLLVEVSLHVMHCPKHYIIHCAQQFSGRTSVLLRTMYSLLTGHQYWIDEHVKSFQKQRYSGTQLLVIFLPAKTLLTHKPAHGVQWMGHYSVGASPAMCLLKHVPWYLYVPDLA